LRFCVKKVCVNQNKTTTVKIVLKRRIPKKLTKELAKEMLEKPWLSWFMFPE
jgi:predicted metal-dependent peptidase